MKQAARLVLLAVAGLLCIGSAGATDALNPTDHVAGHPAVTYFDLVKQIVTDLDSLPAHGEPTAHTIVPYRHIEGDDAKTDPAGPVAIQLLTAHTIHADGKIAPRAVGRSWPIGWRGGGVHAAGALRHDRSGQAPRRG
jgi:hypothetical protein